MNSKCDHRPSGKSKFRTVIHRNIVRNIFPQAQNYLIGKISTHTILLTQQPKKVKSEDKYSFITVLRKQPGSSYIYIYIYIYIYDFYLVKEILNYYELKQHSSTKMFKTVISKERSHTIMVTGTERN
jgi:hypothetical protein